MREFKGEVSISYIEFVRWQSGEWEAARVFAILNRIHWWNMFECYYELNKDCWTIYYYADDSIDAELFDPDKLAGIGPMSFKPVATYEDQYPNGTGRYMREGESPDLRYHTADQHNSRNIVVVDEFADSLSDYAIRLIDKIIRLNPGGSKKPAD